jgi:hypothetical protein
MRLTSSDYRCDICQSVSATEYVRGWVDDSEGGEREVEPHETAVKHICVACEVRGVFYLGMPPVSSLLQAHKDAATR